MRPIEQLPQAEEGALLCLPTYQHCSEKEKKVWRRDKFRVRAGLTTLWPAGWILHLF